MQRVLEVLSFVPSPIPKRILTNGRILRIMKVVMGEVKMIRKSWINWVCLTYRNQIPNETVTIS